MLGPVSAYDGDVSLSLGGPKPRLLLAALLCEPGRVVAHTKLVDTLWGESPPSSCRALVQTYVSSLRKVLTRPGADELIVTIPPGYLLQVRPDDLDSVVFERLVDEGRADAEAGDHAAAVRAFRAADALWCGDPFGGVDSTNLAHAVERLTEMRLSMTEQRIAAELALGHVRDVLAELTALVATYPTRERLRAQLMVTLYRLGRQADALDAYREGRDALVNQLGIDPGPDLQRTHEAILRAEPSLLGSASGAVAAVSAPAQLPAVPADFTGREGPFAELVGRLRPGIRTAGASATCVVVGPSGVGKSTLALRVAHELAPHFPDGQLYADLRGSTATPAQTADVLGRFLRVLDAGAALPDPTDERAERFRTVLASRRVLVMLDDAIDEQQVRPLLPSGAGNAVVITARHRLSGLAGATHLDLDMLSEVEAVELLGRVAGAKRIVDDPVNAREIVGLCGALPLAVRIVGARLASRPHWTLESMVGRLTGEGQRLDELAIADQRVVAGIELTYRGLPADARAALRCLGWLGLPDFPAWIIAPLLGVAATEAEAAMEQLIDAMAVDFSRVDPLGLPRYRIHELIRVYAAQRAVEPDNRASLTASVRRLLLTWVWLIRELSRRTRSPKLTYYLAEPRPLPPEGAVIELVRTDPAAWLDAELYAFVSATERAAALDLADASAALATAVYWSGVQIGGVLESFLVAHSSAVQAARRGLHRAAEAVLLTQLGQLCWQRDRYAESHGHLAEAIEIFRDLGDRRGEAVALAATGATLRFQGRVEDALEAMEQAHAYFITVPSPEPMLAFTTGTLGLIRLDHGDFAAARADLVAALATNRGIGSRRGEAMSIWGLGLLHRAIGDLERALDLCQQAREISRSIAHDLGEAYYGQAVAKTLVRLGRGGEALPILAGSLTTCQRLGDRLGEGMALRTRGELHLAAGRLTEADDDLTHARELFTAIDARLMCTRTERDLATLRDAQGDPSGAATLRRAALEAFAALGAREHGELASGGE